MTNFCKVHRPWDTSFLGFPVGQIYSDQFTEAQAQAVELWQAKHDLRVVYFLARFDDPKTVQVATSWHWQLVDARLELQWDSSYTPKEKPFRPAIYPIRQAVPEDTEALVEIALQSYTLPDSMTRFSFDPHMPAEVSQRLYEVWIRNSLSGYADAVLVVGKVGQPTGYISCHLDKDSGTGKIGLVGVHPRAQGNGVGRALVMNALDWFTEHGVREVSVVTQGRNVRAQRLYQRCGFVTESFGLWFHKWWLQETKHAQVSSS